LRGGAISSIILRRCGTVRSPWAYSFVKTVTAECAEQRAGAELLLAELLFGDSM
jgi:hypothetical protein